MELNEFKSAWEAVDKRLTEISEQNAENLRLTVLSKKSDIKNENSQSLIHQLRIDGDMPDSSGHIKALGAGAFPR